MAWWKGFCHAVGKKAADSKNQMNLVSEFLETIVSAVFHLR